MHTRGQAKHDLCTMDCSYISTSMEQLLTSYPLTLMNFHVALFPAGIDIGI